MKEKDTKYSKILQNFFKSLKNKSKKNRLSSRLDRLKQILISMTRESPLRVAFNKYRSKVKRLSCQENADIIQRYCKKVKEKRDKDKSSIPYYRRLYSNEFMEFENDRTNSIHYVKKYKEDDITFTKSKILPEIQWQDLDNDVDTSDEQKRSAIRKEVNWLGEAIKQIQNNEKFLKHNVTMYKLSQKYPNQS